MQCDACGSVELKEVTTDALGKIVFEKDLLCGSCNKLLNHWHLIDNWTVPYTKTGRIAYSLKSKLKRLLKK